MGKYMTDAQINDDALSDFVKSADGKEASKKVWKELREILDSIQPGVTSNLWLEQVMFSTMRLKVASLCSDGSCLREVDVVTNSTIALDVFIVSTH